MHFSLSVIHDERDGFDEDTFMNRVLIRMDYPDPGEETLREFNIFKRICYETEKDLKDMTYDEISKLGTEILEEIMSEDNYYRTFDFEGNQYLYYNGGISDWYKVEETIKLDPDNYIDKYYAVYIQDYDDLLTMDNGDDVNGRIKEHIDGIGPDELNNCYITIIDCHI